MNSFLLLHGGLYILTGLFAGLASGLLGVGGGIIVVPGLLFIFKAQNVIPEHLITHMAAATSLALMILTSLVSIITHYQLGTILWSVFKRLWLGLILGVLLGALIAQGVSIEIFKIIFAVFLFIVAFKMLRERHNTYVKKPKAWMNHLISLLAGSMSGLLGVGGGMLIVPYLTASGFPIKTIAAVSNLCTLCVALTGTVLFMLLGSQMDAPPYSTGYIYWPALVWMVIPSCFIAPWAVKLNYIIPGSYLRYSFILLLFLVALNLLL